MARMARSARGQVVDFDVIAIKQQLASKPVPVGVGARRKFIDEKDGIRHRENFIVPPAPAVVQGSALPSALSIAVEAAGASEAAAKVAPKKHAHKEPA